MWCLLNFHKDTDSTLRFAGTISSTIIRAVGTAQSGLLISYNHLYARRSAECFYFLPLPFFNGFFGASFLASFFSSATGPPCVKPSARFLPFLPLGL